MRAPRSGSPVVDELFRIAYRRGMNQSEIALRIGTYPARVNGWFTGRNSPTQRSVDEFAQAIGVEIVIREKRPDDDEMDYGDGRTRY